MYCIDSTCDIVGTFRGLSSDSAPPYCPPLVTPLHTALILWSMLNTVFIGHVCKNCLRGFLIGVSQGVCVIALISPCFRLLVQQRLFQQSTQQLSLPGRQSWIFIFRSLGCFNLRELSKSVLFV